MMRLICSSALTAAIALTSALSSFATEGFAWKDTEGKFTDLTYDGRSVVRYMYERIDESSKERRDLTYKPFHHVYDQEGKELITKGAGGKFPHHRGIYYGFSKCSFTDAEGKEHKGQDTWHCRDAHQTHEGFENITSDAKTASHTVLIDWHAKDGQVFAKEKRTLEFSLIDSKDLVVDFSSTLTPVFSQMKLDGDPQHAGFQFRATNEVAAETSAQTYYLRPKSGKGAMKQTINWSSKADTEATRDLPWKVMSFVTKDNRYSVAYLDRPNNPKPARFSERDYGRFGSYFVREIKKSEPFTAQYRLVIRKGEFTMDEADSLSASFLKP